MTRLAETICLDLGHRLETVVGQVHVEVGFERLNAR